MPRFEPVIDVVESLCLRSGDIEMRKRMLFLDCANDVWNDLNEDVLRIADRIKMPVRMKFRVDKRTNSIILPCNALRVCSVNIIDRHNIMYPVFRNENLNNDFFDPGAVKDCACEFKCGYQLCNSIKGYEVINHTEIDKNPDGTEVSFACIDKKVVIDGFLYEQKQYPLRQYVSGVWVDTVLHTENIKRCKLDVDKNGCVCDTQANIDNICHSCNLHHTNTDQCNSDNCCVGGTAMIPPKSSCNTWTYYCSSILDWFGVQCGSFPCGRIRGENIYNIDDTGKRLIFPRHFGWDNVVVRFYADIDLNNLMIPYIAKETFMTGMMYFSLTNNPKKIQEASFFGQKYSRQKYGLSTDLNKYRLEELRMIMTPPVFVPSYFDRDYNWDY